MKKLIICTMLAAAFTIESHGDEIASPYSYYAESGGDICVEYGPGGMREFTYDGASVHINVYVPFRSDPTRFALEYYSGGSFINRSVLTNTGNVQRGTTGRGGSFVFRYDQAIYTGYNSDYHTYDFYYAAPIPGDEDEDGIPDNQDPDINGDGLLNEIDPTAYNFVGGSGCAVYASNGDGLADVSTNTVSSVMESAGVVEVWPDRSVMADAGVGQNSRNVTWRCVVFDQGKNAFKGLDGKPVVFAVVPEWRKFSEVYQ